MSRARRLEKLETKQLAMCEAWLQTLTSAEFLAYYQDLERRDPEQMAYLQTLTDEQLRKIAYGVRT